jgi:primosomal replication protein N
LTYLKEIGNKHFRQGRLLDANDYYTNAIETAPYVEVGPTGVELLRLKLEFEEVQQEAWPNAVNLKWTMQRLTTHKMTTAKSH